MANRNEHVRVEVGGQIYDAVTQYLQAVLLELEQASFPIMNHKHLQRDRLHNYRPNQL